MCTEGEQEEILMAGKRVTYIAMGARPLNISYADDYTSMLMTLSF
jgi:hypothetical protein